MAFMIQKVKTVRKNNTNITLVPALALAFTFALVFGVSGSYAEQVRLESSSFQEVKTKTESLIQKYGAKNVLLVLDIDNTLLASNQNLGSDQWYYWQERGLADPAFKQKVGAEMGDLLRTQGILFSLSKGMTPPENETPSIVRDLQSKGLKTLVLTSRGPEFRSETERALSGAGYQMAETSIGPKGGYVSKWLPDETLIKKEFTEAEITAMNLAKVRNTSFMDGIMMTSGQHKGAMLRYVLRKVNETYKAIVFVDDHAKHVDRVLEAFKPLEKIEVLSVRYGKEDARVKEFNESKSAQTKVAGQWAELSKLIDRIFVKNR